MKPEDLWGSYELVSWHRRDREPFGGGTLGYLHYAEDGTMSASLMKPDRPAIGFSPEQLRKARKVLLRPWTIPGHLPVLKAVGRYLQASANFVAYSGTYELRGNQVIHHVELSLIPDWVGTDLVREISIVGDLVTLKTPEGDTLVWRRRSSRGLRDD